MRKLTVILFMLGVWGAVRAQNIQLTASAPRVVEAGEQFQLEFSVNARPSAFVVPPIKDFDVGGPYTSSSSNIQMINGKVSQSVTYSYIYALQAKKPGKYMIGAAEATVDGKKYQSNTVTVEVVGSGTSAPGTASGNTQQQPAGVTSTGDLFLRVLVDKTNVVQGEYLTATVKVYSKYNISGIDNLSPVFNGFFVQEIEIPRPHMERENVNGQVLGSAVLKKYILIPQREGKVRIDPVEMSCTVQQSVQGRSGGSLFDDFFGPQVQDIPKKMKSLPVTINVRPLPQGQPESFNGAVGRFGFEAALDKADVKANDAVTLKLTITGTGNLKLIEPPKINFPPDFDTFDPKVTLNTSASGGDITGTKTFEYLLIPRNAGNFRISPVSFTYYDLVSGKYKTISSNEFTLNVEKGTDTQSTALVSGLSKEDVKYIGKDIRFIKTGHFAITRANHYFFASLGYWAVFVAGLLVFILIIILRRRIIRQNANIALMRNRKADKFATRRLKNAKQHLDKGDTGKFYEELLKAIWGYLSDKLNIPLADLSRESARDMLEKRSIEAELSEQFIRLVDSGEYARYAPSSAGNSMKDDYDAAVQWITKVQHKLR